MSVAKQNFRLKLIANARLKVRASKAGNIQQPLSQAVLIENRQKAIEKEVEALRKQYAHLL